MKHILHIENQKQKSFEKLLGITRIDPFSGGELITLYLEFIRTKNEKLLLPLLLHNKEDVTHMASLLSLLSITDLFHGKFFVNHTETNTYTGIHNFEKQDFTMMLSLEQALPIRISYQQDGICFLAEEQSARLSIPVLCDTLKLFFDNYKEYDYLPMEDRAIHKSIATFVDSSCKKAATPSTCYDKVFGNFIPIYNNDVPYAPYFQHHRKEKPAYIRLNDLKEEYMNAYALHILSHFR